MALPTKKLLSYEQSESARRGKPSKSLILAGGDKRAYPAERVSIVKRSFTIGYII